jgi:hypothetical protein
MLEQLPVVWLMDYGDRQWFRMGSQATVSYLSLPLFTDVFISVFSDGLDDGLDAAVRSSYSGVFLQN